MRDSPPNPIIIPELITKDRNYKVVNQTKYVARGPSTLLSKNMLYSLSRKAFWLNNR